MIKTDLGEIIYSLSKALDTSANGIAYHHHTVALISMAIAKKLRIADSDRDMLFLSALVHDAGAVTNNEISELTSFEDTTPFDHCRKGYYIFYKSTYTRKIGEILLHHHDR